MARIRQIKPEFYLDDDLALCPRDARLMFPGLWILADRAGRLEDRPARIKAQLFPYDDDIEPATIDELLDLLDHHDFILRYEVAGKRYIQIRTFEKHQHCHVKEPPSQLPSPPKLRSRHHINTIPESDKTGAGTVQESEEHRSSTSASTSGYMDNGCLSVGVGSSSGEGGLGEGGKPSASKSDPHTHTAAADFVLTDELREWAEALAPDMDPEDEAGKFRDYYGRNGKTFRDLPAAWRKWFRDAVDRQNRARAPTVRRESRAERNERIIREVEAEDRAKTMSAGQGGPSP